MQEDIIRDIRRKCRLAMNGIASTSMRQRGMMYKVNFGLAIAQIKDIANNYEPDADLADKLWKEDTRELKILATLLYPINAFERENASQWVNEINNQEIREQVCLNLFQNLPYTNQLVKEWGKSEDKEVRTSGYWLLARLFLTKKAEHVEADLFPFIWDDAISDDTFLRNASLLALKHIGRQSNEEADAILSNLEKYKDSEDLVKQEAYNSLSFEFEFYFE